MHGTSLVLRAHRFFFSLSLSLSFLFIVRFFNNLFCFVMLSLLYEKRWQKNDDSDETFCCTKIPFEKYLERRSLWPRWVGEGMAGKWCSTPATPSNTKTMEKKNGVNCETEIRAQYVCMLLWVWTKWAFDNSTELFVCIIFQSPFYRNAFPNKTPFGTLWKMKQFELFCCALNLYLNSFKFCGTKVSRFTCCINYNLPCTSIPLKLTFDILVWIDQMV